MYSLCSVRTSCTNVQSVYQNASVQSMYQYWRIKLLEKAMSWKVIHLTSRLLNITFCGGTAGNRTRIPRVSTRRSNHYTAMKHVYQCISMRKSTGVSLGLQTPMSPVQSYSSPVHLCGCGRLQLFLLETFGKVGQQYSQDKEQEK